MSYLYNIGEKWTKRFLKKFGCRYSKQVNGDSGGRNSNSRTELKEEITYCLKEKDWAETHNKDSTQ